MSVKLKSGADARAMRVVFPPEFKQKVDMSKVNLALIKVWVQNEVARILGNDDDVVIEMIMGMLEGNKSPNIKQLQTDVTGFLDKDAAPFCLSLWKLCLSAQENAQGIPKELLEAKKEELMQERLADEKAREEAIRRQDEEREHDREMERMRDRERGQRGRGGRGFRGRDRDRDRDDRDRDYNRSYDRRPPPPRYSRSRSPPPRRREGRGGTDSYMPNNRGRRDDNPRRRRRSPSYGRSPVRSRSPPRRRQRRNTNSPDASRSPPPRRIREGSADIDKPSREDDRRRLRSQSPRTKRRASPDYNNNTRRRSRSRSPPRRDRRGSVSTRSRSPPSQQHRRSSAASNDLISRTDRTSNSHRLQAPHSRDNSSYGGDSRRGSDAKSVDGGAVVADEKQPLKERKKGVPIPREEVLKRLHAAKLENARLMELKRAESADSEKR